MKPTLTEKDYRDAAFQLGCEVAAIKAVAYTETAGAGFDSQDQPTILFERHIFSRLTGGRYDVQYPDISNKTPGGYGLQSAQHSRLQKAVALDRDAALKSASWGKFQIMGNEYREAGFSTLQEFINAMYKGEREQLFGFVNVIIAYNLKKALQARDWATFARKYNGVNYRINKYDEKMAAAYKKFS